MNVHVFSVFIDRPCSHLSVTLGLNRGLSLMGQCRSDFEFGGGGGTVVS